MITRVLEVLRGRRRRARVLERGAKESEVRAVLYNRARLGIDVAPRRCPIAQPSEEKRA